MEREGTAVTCDGRLFHRRAAATVSDRQTDRQTDRDGERGGGAAVMEDCCTVDIINHNE